MNRTDIQREYERLGYDRGWSFLYVPEARLRTAEVALVGLNPGGSEDGGGQWDQPEGNAYALQKWAKDNRSWSPLQHQVAALLDAIGARQEDILAAQFIPFRSPRLASLARPGEARAFGRKLWRWALEQTPAKRFFCLGNDVTDELVALSGAKLEAEFSTSWGQGTREQKFRRYVAGDRVFVRLPHLSSYRVFDRAGDLKASVAESIKAAGTRA